MKKILFCFFIILKTFNLSSDVTSQKSSIKGNLILKGLNLEAKYTLVSLSKEHHLLIIFPKGAKNGCFFRVTKISAPQNLRGRNGIIFANRPPGCVFAMNEKKQKDFWSKIVLVDFDYGFSQNTTLSGHARLSSKSGNYKAKLIFQ